MERGLVFHKPEKLLDRAVSAAANSSGEARAVEFLRCSTALRKLDQLVDAELALLAAKSNIQSPRARADLHLRWSLVRCEQECWNDALTFAWHAVELAAVAGDSDLSSSAELALGNILVQMPRYEAAIAAYRRSLGSGSSSERIHAASTIGVVNALARSGAVSGERLASEVQKLPLSDPGYIGVQARWVASLAAIRSGEIDTGARGIESARDFFIEQRMPAVAAAALVDLAYVNYCAGSFAEVEAQASIALSLLRNKGVNRATKAALILLTQSRVQESAERLRRFWGRSRPRAPRR